MKKTIYLKSFILLCTLLAGVVSAHAEDYDYEWVKTSFSNLATGDIVVLVDENLEEGPIALPNNDSDFRGVSVNVSRNKLSGTVTDDIQWKLTINGNTVNFRCGNVPLSAKSGPKLTVDNGITSDFTYNNGQLSCKINNKDYYIAWSAAVDFYRAVLQEGILSPNYLADFTFYKKVTKRYVKWKKVDLSSIENGDLLAIVDLTTVNAMSNDKGADKSPAVVAVELNADKDRITGSVADNIQWIGNVTEGGKSFVTPSDAEKMLIGKSDGLRVGGASDGSSVFSFTNDFLSTQMDSKTYYAGVKASFMSNTWELLEAGEGGTVSDDIKDTQIAFFKKVESRQKITTLKFASDNFAANLRLPGPITLGITCTGAPTSDIQWTSSNTNVATVNSDGEVSLRKRGTVVITASVPETDFHDKAFATCTLRIDDPSTSVPGSINRPFTVEQAKQLIESENKTIEIDNQTVTWEEGVNYYIKGKVSKVNSGMLAMFGDMDFGDLGGIGGGTGTGEGGSGGMDFDEMMDDMDFDMDSMDEMGFDMSSLGFDMSSLFGSSDGVTYYISDDGTKDNQLKVINGRGEIKSNNGGAIEYGEAPNLSPGDCVIVCGPLVESEDTNMLSSLMGGSSDEPKTSWKVGELNYMYNFDPTLHVVDSEVYVNKTLDGAASNPLEGNDLYSIDNEFNIYNNEIKITVSEELDGKRVEAPTYKSSDEEIAKWDEETNKIIGVNEGTAKITVKVKVIVVADDPVTEDENEEKSYTMKRKFKLTVKTRDLDPAGYYNGDYVLTTSVGDLKDGTRLLLVGTRVKDDNNTDYIMGENSSMMGGGKSGTKITIKDNMIPCEDVPTGTLEVVLEEADASSWYLNVGEDENGNKLYLYASEKAKTEESGSEGEGSGSGFNMDEMMEMFNPSSGLKVGTIEKADSLKATITFEGNVATIKYSAITGEDGKNTIMLSSAFDMESMMNMFGGNEEGEEGEGEGGGTGTSTTSFDMGSFDMFMASFNTKKPDDEKSFLPRIYCFVPDKAFDISIGDTGWKTIVTYNNVEVPENVEAYIVKDVQTEGTETKAILNTVEKLKGGEPYLLYTTSGDTYTMALTEEEVEAPTNNKLMKSDRTTTGSDATSTVFVLANMAKGVGFYRWVGDELGAGRVYLPVETSVAGVHEYCGFFVDDSSAIQSVESAELSEGNYYDLQGRLVLKPGKGLYVLDGKKVIIK